MRRRDLDDIALPYRWFFLRGNFARNVMETLKVCIIQIKLILIVCPAPTPIYFSLPTNSCHSCHFHQRLEPMGRVWPSAGPRLPQAALLPEQASAAGVPTLLEWLKICVVFWNLSANILSNAFPIPRASVVATLVLATPWSLWRGKTRS